MEFGTPFRQSYMQVANTVFTDLANLIVLRCQQNAATTWSTPRQNFATAGYVVPAGKSLRILAIEIWQQCTVAALDVFNSMPSYCDNDTGMDGTTAATNEVKLMNAATRLACQTTATILTNHVAVSVWLEVPTGKYLIQRAEATAPRAYYAYYGYLV